MEKQKINLIYDASILANALSNDSGRSGIFFTAKNIFDELIKRDDINIALYSSLNDFYNLNKYLKLEYKDYNFKIFVNTKYPKIVNIYSSIIEERKELKKQKRPIKRFLLKILLFIIKPIYKISIKNRNKNLNDEISQYDSFLSPIYKIPEEVAKNSKIKKCTIVYDTIPLILPEYHPDSYNGSWYHNLLKSFNNNDYYFAISNSARQDFLKYCSQIDPNKITTTLLACDEKFKPVNLEEIKKAKEKYNIPMDKKYIFSLCTLEPRKNLIRAVKTFIQFIQKNNVEDLVFVLGGGHWDMFIGQLEKEIDNLGDYRDKIIKAGYIDDEDLAPLYSGAEWFVYTSQYEGFGLPPLEAMSCGCPVITSNNSSLPEVVGDAGIMIDWDNDEQHIQSYEKYYYDENLRKENSQKGLERAREFSWEICAKQMIEVIKSVSKTRN